jgi:Cu2+-containing amine oxidase
VKRLVLGLVLTLLLATTANTAWAQCSTPYLVEQAFPTSGPEETRWRICWQSQGKHGLVITAAFFRKSPSSPFMRVFWDARLGEIFVPYHPGSPRFLDLSTYSQGLVTLNSAHCPASAGGTLLGSPAVVCKEVHDRGLAWMNDSNARRGQEVVLWGTIDAYNYNNVVYWAFRDDGAVEGRYGATALNLPGSEDIAHMHTPIWRLDIDFNGFADDSVYVASHVESGASATDSSTLVSKEAGLEWKADEFTTLHIHDRTLKNGKGQGSMYHLMPLRWGRPRHQERFTQWDFWVTRYKGSELWAKDLPTYTSNGENVVNEDVVVWYMGAVHHLPRAEDGESVNGVFRGAAHLMWTGWLLKPHNVFDRTPLFERQK